jgi:hypothetical protein
MRRLESGKQMSCEATAHLTAGWPTPRSAEAGPDFAIQDRENSGGLSIQTTAQLSSWPTPRAEDGESSGMRHSRGVADTLTAVAGLTEQPECKGWVTPNQRDWKDSPGMTAERKDGASREDQLPRQAYLTGWTTPQTADEDMDRRSTDAMEREAQRDQSGQNLALEARTLSGWPTATGSDAKGSRRHGQMINGAEGTTMTKRRKAAKEKHGQNGFGMTLGQTVAAECQGWPTPMAGTPAQNGNNEAGNTDSSRRTEALAGREIAGSGVAMIEQWGPARLTADGQLLTGSSAETAPGGQLNPELPRWLMRLPVAWGSCAPTVTASTLKRQRASSKS